MRIQPTSSFRSQQSYLPHEASPAPSPTPTQQCSLNSTSTTPKLILSVFPINCKVASLQHSTSPSHNPRSPSHTKISALPTRPASTPPVSQPVFHSPILPRPSSDPSPEPTSYLTHRNPLPAPSFPYLSPALLGFAPPSH